MRPKFYKNYVLTVLTALLVFNYVDRLALGIMLQDIKTDLNLSDTQLGVLTGIAFAVFYSVMGIPIARWADRGNRVTIISLTTLIWTAAVAMCGLAMSFVQLVLIRIAVAVGEAGCIPPAFSLLADYFNRAERPRASAIYGLGGPLATVIGFFLAGWLNELYGWRLTFAILAAPGLLMAACAWLTLRDPRYQASSALVQPVELTETSTPQPKMREVITTLLASYTFRNLMVGLSVLFFFNYGIWLWQPAFFIRSFDLSTSEVGMWLAIVCGVAGILGVYIGGELASRYAGNNERLQLQAVAVAMIIGGVLTTFVYITRDKNLAFALAGVGAVGINVASGPVFAAIQTLVPQRMRAVAFALIYFVANLIGMGLGPLAAGVLSDGLQPWGAKESLRYALLILSPGYFVVAWLCWRASTTVEGDLVAVSRKEAAAQGETAMTAERLALDAVAR